MNAVVSCQHVRFENDVKQKRALVAGFKKGYEHFPQRYQDYNGNCWDSFDHFMFLSSKMSAGGGSGHGYYV